MARVADQLIETLRNDIRSGALRPGDQLEEAALAERFGVSRTPVREAVRSLVDCGLLETRPRKGAFVRVLSAKELIDLFEVAAELEGMACRLAAERLTADKAAALEDALQFCRRAADENNQDDYAKANLAFHKAIHDAAGNNRLIEQIEQLAGHMQRGFGAGQSQSDNVLVASLQSLTEDRLIRPIVVGFDEDGRLRAIAESRLPTG